MTVIFVANVGNRDVQVTGEHTLPTKARLLGQMILDDWATYADRVELPILGKALDWVTRPSAPLAQIVLIASDQADVTYRDSDTILLAEIVRRVLTERESWRKRVKPESIRIHRVDGNPADYDFMMHYYENLMSDLAAEPAETVYLAISGGTPAMASMLMLKGVMAFGERAYPLYVTPSRAMPMSLDIGRQLTVDATQNDFQRSLNVFQYHAALALLDSRAELLRQAWPAFSALRAVVDYARQRLNFDFEGAQRAIFGAERGLPDSLANRIYALADEVHADHRTTEWLLREVLHTAEISFKTGAYADFLGRAFRLSEGLTDCALERWTDEQVFVVREERTPDGDVISKRAISEKWLDEHVAAWEFLESKEIKLGLGVTRKTLLALAEYFAGSNNTRRQVVKYLNRLDALGSYRNQMPFAHGYAGVSLESLKARYKTEREDEILRNLKWLVETVTAQPPGDNPYTAINALILDLMRESE